MLGLVRILFGLGAAMLEVLHVEVHDLVVAHRVLVIAFAIGGRWSAFAELHCPVHLGVGRHLVVALGRQNLCRCFVLVFLRV